MSILPLKKAAGGVPYLAFHAASERGPVRENNEDSFELDEAAGVAVVADGLGGQPAGEVAARMATAIVSAGLGAARREMHGQDNVPEIVQRITECVAAANFSIMRDGMEQAEHAGMCTTLDAVLVLGWRAFIAHVGDGRAYLIRNGAAFQITQDHSLSAELELTGSLREEDPATVAAYENILTRALGTPETLVVDLIRVDVRPGDAILICTDGLWKKFPERSELARMVARERALAARKLVTEAATRGGEDNATAVVVFFGEISEEIELA